MVEACTLLRELLSTVRLFFDGPETLGSSDSHPESEKITSMGLLVLFVSDDTLALATSANKPVRKSELYDEMFTTLFEFRIGLFFREKRTPLPCALTEDVILISDSCVMFGLW